MISRRNFLKVSAQSMAALGGGAMTHWGQMSAFAQATGEYRALVCVFLQGGNDGNNLIVPLESTAYQSYARARGPLTLPQSSLLPIATPAGEAFGLHPQLAGYQSLFARGQLAIVANVGTLVEPLSRDSYQQRSASLPRNLFSHLDQQMAWQTGAPAGGTTYGWGGRIADQLTPASGASFPSVVSVAGSAVFTTGETAMPATIIPGMAPGLAGLDGSYGAIAREQSLQQMLTLDGGAVLVQAANERTREGLRQAERLNAATASQPTLATEFPRTDLGVQLYEIARVIQARESLGVSRQIFFCALDGFDTHTSQLSLQDRAFAQLGAALAAFSDAMTEIGVARHVTTFTQSEFGRTLQPTSGTGSDHAWGSHHVVMGGAVNGGRIYGQMPTLALGGPDDVGGRGVWLPTLSLDQYGATLASWFGVAPSDLPTVFPNLPNFDVPTLEFLSV